MEGLISAFIFIFICVSIWAFTTWRKLKNMENLKELVGWSVHEDNSLRYNIPLWVHFRDAQLKECIQDKYQITGEEEWEEVKDIIAKYQKELTNSYFEDRLWAMKSIYEIRSKDYFIYMLYVYLCEDVNYAYWQNSVFRFRNVRNRVERKNIVFHKMRYITYMYCKENLALQKNVPSWNEGVLKGILDEDFSKEQMASHKIPVPGDPGVKVNYRGRT